MRGDLGLAVERVDSPEPQLELGLHVDDAVVDDRRTEQEVGVMAVSDDDGSAERLAQTRAERRHLRRLRTAERRDAAHEHAADRRAEGQAETGSDPLATPPLSSADTRQLLAAEQDELALERGSLVADRDVDDGIEMGM